ncbi:MAG: hypothetical protein KBB01_05725 [Candidatus Omnitrophica bacterium]|jgi:hypothetical protein|nr:hypothetical protein [Candidatus Omnitrophota bacterium]
MKKAVTLMELLIAVGLLMVVILGATSFHFASTEFLWSSERKADILNEFTLVLENLDKNIKLATGDIDNQGISLSRSGNVWTLIVRQDLRSDINAAGTLWAPLLTPYNYSDDRKVKYVFDIDNNRVTFHILNNGGMQVFEEKLTDRFVDPGGATPFRITLESGGVYFDNFALRYNPRGDDRFYANISLAYDPGDGAPNGVMFFFPLSHSQS